MCGPLAGSIGLRLRSSVAIIRKMRRPFQSKGKIDGSARSSANGVGYCGARTASVTSYRPGVVTSTAASEAASHATARLPVDPSL